MRKLLLNLSKFLMALAMTCSAAAVCVWSSLPSGGDDCKNENCGVGCDIVGYGPNQVECYTGGYPSAGCCICAWYTIECECIFGPGSGSVYSSLYYPPDAYCDAAGTPPVYHCKDALGQTLPDPDFP